MRHPDVKAYHPPGRVLTVWGTPMRRGETPRKAAEEWVIAHEYAHHVLDQPAGIEYGDNESFHEGFSDTLGLLVFDTEFQGEHFWGCDEHIRWPRQTSPPIFHTYPMCGETSTCSMGAVFDGDPHCIGELLGALWRDMHDEFEEETRDLFLDWMMIAQVPGCEDCEEPFQFCFPQSADAGTLVEVLQVAGNQKAPAICFIFGQRQIFHPPPTPNPCQESAGRFCYADCDGSAFLDFFDFLCFQNAFATTELYADCDGDSEFSFFDFLCFQNEFVAGCL